MPIKPLYLGLYSRLDTLFYEIYSPTLYWLNNWHEDDTQAQSNSSRFCWSGNRFPCAAVRYCADGVYANQFIPRDPLWWTCAWTHPDSSL